MAQYPNYSFNKMDLFTSLLTGDSIQRACNKYWKEVNHETRLAKVKAYLEIRKLRVIKSTKIKKKVNKI